MSYQKDNLNITKDKFDAVLFDLDGVITRTARVHSASWKQLFDEYLKKWAEKTGEKFVPFDERKDYLEYVDGMPRYEGVKSFLKSRGIELPYGDPSAPPGDATITALGNMKNIFFHENLGKIGVDVYESSIALIKLLRKKGFKTAVVSSSKNTSSILESASITDLFEAQVDGVLSAKIGLIGKPEPDIFLEAAQRLGADPSRAMVFEDAVSGVQSGKRGGFGLVVGVDRTGNEEELKRNGADIVVKDLDEFKVEGQSPSSGAKTSDLPWALDNVENIRESARGREMFIALDYDGTLTPIVDRPDLAMMSNDMREAVQKLATVRTVAIISGRDLGDVRNLVKIDGLIYAGSHGFDIYSPGENKKDDGGFQMGRDILPELDRTEKILDSKLKDIKGSLIERKKFSIAVHYRLVSEDEAENIEKIVDEVIDSSKSLKKGLGKKVFEIRPDMDWDKGKALLWVLDSLGYNLDSTLTIYIGDDTTDEDAFRELKDKGTGIFVLGEEHDQVTYAHYYLKDTTEVKELLNKLAEKNETGGH